MSGEQFQQWSQGSPLLSLDRFHLKQTPVLNFNCRDSLGFPSYILHKKTFFSAWFAFSSVASLNFSLPKWLALHFQNVCLIFLFIAQMGFFGTSGGQLGFWLEGLGARLGILWDPSRLGSFCGSLFFGILGTP